ncbi:hypothetical protein OXX79_001047 [Metschnikowia pulcherrima]
MSAFSRTFIKCCAIVLQSKPSEEIRARQLAKVIDSLDLSPSNLAVALIYLHKYQSNTVNTLDRYEADTLHHYMIITSLILANKFINDQSYTLKTWLSVLHKCSDFRPSLALLNQLESNFLAALDFALNTNHDALLWAQFPGLNRSHVTQMSMAVNTASCMPPCGETHMATPPSGHFGLATPSSVNTIYASPLSYMGTLSPTPGAPFTPISLPTGVMALPMSQFLHMYPSPVLQHTPERMAEAEWPQKKRRKTHAACGTGFACEPAYAACFNV